MIESPTEKTFRSQFVQLMQELSAIRPNWVSCAWFDALRPITRDAGKVADDWRWRDRGVLQDFEPAMSHFYRDKLVTNVYTDLARSSLMQADLSPDGTYAGLLRKVPAIEGVGTVSGERQLRLLFPDVRYLTWQDVEDLRRDQGLSDLRDKLRELERGGGTDDDMRDRAVTEFVTYLEDVRPTWRKWFAQVGWTILGSVPGLSVPTAGAQMAIGAKDVLAADRHWTATLVKARRIAEERRG